MATLLSYALTDVASVKESLGIVDGSKDNLIIRKINQATLMIESYCGLAADHHFKQTTYTNETFNADNTNQISLLMSPVTSVGLVFQRATSLTSDTSYDTVESQDYFLDENAGTLNLLFSTVGVWDSYRVTYTAGYATIPADLAEACVMLASFLIENSASGSQVTRKKEGQREIEYATSLSERAIFDQLGLDDMLSRYIRYSIG